MSDFEATFTDTAKAVEEADGDVIVEGYCADWEPDRQNEIFEPGAFRDAIKRASEGAVPLLYEHDLNRPLGLVEELREDENGLWLRARIAVAKTGEWSESVIDKIKRGFLRGLSVRGLSKVQRTPSGQTRIGWMDLAEVSVTAVPAQRNALFAVASKAIAADADDDEGLQELIDRAERLNRKLARERCRPAATRKSIEPDAKAAAAKARRLLAEVRRETAAEAADSAKSEATHPRRQPVYHPPSSGSRSGDEVRVERSGVSLADIHGDTARGGLSVRSEEKDEEGETTRREYTLPAGSLDWGDPRPPTADSRLEDGPPSPEEGLK